MLLLYSFILRMTELATWILGEMTLSVILQQQRAILAEMFLRYAHFSQSKHKSQQKHLEINDNICPGDYSVFLVPSVSVQTVCIMTWLGPALSISEQERVRKASWHKLFIWHLKNRACLRVTGWPGQGLVSEWLVAESRTALSCSSFWSLRMASHEPVCRCLCKLHGHKMIWL